VADDVLLLERRDGVAVVTLNRPRALNALNRALRNALAETFRALRADADVRVAVMTGAGRAFCAGLDLKELASDDGAILDRSADEMRAAVERFDRPLIGAVNGFAVTGGFELALMCDLLIASPEAHFADTHARVGLVPGWGLSQRLARWIGVGRAKELSFTGNYLSAEQAAAWGLVNRVVPGPELLPTCLALADDMLSCNPTVLQEVKRLIDTGYATTLEHGLRLEDAAARAHAARVSSADIATRRAAVQARGRTQSRS
jgi:enoyl-CoA hydratase